MTQVNRQAERSERSTEALLDAAAELIAEGGLSSMTLAAIGERAGYSRGLVTARFGSKAGLVDALIRRVWGQLHAARVVPLAHGRPGLQEILELIGALTYETDAHERDVRALLALMFEALGPDPDLRARMVEFHDSMRSEIAAALRAGVEDGSVRVDADADAAAALIVSAMRGFAYQWLLDSDSIDLTACYAELGDLVRTRYGA